MSCWKRAGHKKTALRAALRLRRHRMPHSVKAVHFCSTRLASAKLNYWDKPSPGFAERVMEQISRGADFEEADRLK